MVAIVFGVRGRAKAKAAGASAAQATVGLVLGIVNIVVTLVAVVAWSLLLGAASDQLSKGLDQADQAFLSASLLNAKLAMGQRYQTTGNYDGMTADTLRQYGFERSPDENLTVVVLNGGQAYCIEGYNIGNPSAILHITNVDSVAGAGSCAGVKVSPSATAAPTTAAPVPGSTSDPFTGTWKNPADPAFVVQVSAPADGVYPVVLSSATSTGGLDLSARPTSPGVYQAIDFSGDTWVFTLDSTGSMQVTLAYKSGEQVSADNLVRSTT